MARCPQLRSSRRSNSLTRVVGRDVRRVHGLPGLEGDARESQPLDRVLRADVVVVRLAVVDAGDAADACRRAW